MAPLLALPNEALLEIIKEVCPGSLPHLALSCKRMLSLSQDCLTVHAERQKKYTTLEFNKCSDHGNRDRPLELLRGITDDWRIAFYPKKIFIGCKHCSFLSANDESNEVVRAEDIRVTEQLNSIIEGFESAMIKKDRTGYPRIESHEVRRWNLGDWNTVLSLLLTKLRNIEFLTLGGRLMRARGLLIALWNLIEINLDPSYTGLSNFPKLKNFTIDGTKFDYANVRIMKCFALLPSVECLVGSNVRSASSHGTDDLLGGYDSALEDNLMVKEVDLYHSNLSLESLSLFFRGMTRLKKFTHSFSTFYPSTDPYRLIDLLLCSKMSLEHLVLVCYCHSQVRLPRGAGYGSLREFEALKSVCVNVSLWIVSERNRKAAHLEEGYSQTEEGFVNPLVEVLPSSIETIELIHDEFLLPIPMGDVDRLLEGLTGSKGQRLHSLKTVVFRNVERPSGPLEVLANAWIEGCAEIGVSLTLEWDTYCCIWEKAT